MAYEKAESEHTELFERIISEIKDVYCTERCKAQRIDRFTPGPKYDIFFKRAAEICIRNQISPKEFILVQFFALKPYPELSVIGSSAALERFAKYRHQYAFDAANSVYLQLQAYENLISAGWDPKEVLVDPNQGFDSLFIYIVADTHDYPDIKEAYFDNALIQYMCGFYYEQIYTDAIPVELREKAERIRREL